MRSLRRTWSVCGESNLDATITETRTKFAECLLDHCLWDVYDLARPTPNHPEAARISGLLNDSTVIRHAHDEIKREVNARLLPNALFKRVMETNPVQLCDCRAPQRVPGSRKELERGCFGTILGIARLDDTARDSVLRRLPLLKVLITGWKSQTSTRQYGDTSDNIHRFQSNNYSSRYRLLDSYSRFLQGLGPAGEPYVVLTDARSLVNPLTFALAVQIPKLAWC